MKVTGQESLVELYRASFPAAARLIRRMGGTQEEAKDLFHDALLIFLERERAGSLQLRTSAQAYLLGVTKILWLHNRKQPLDDLPEEVEQYIYEEQAPPEGEKQLLDYLQLAGQKCLQLLQSFYFEHRNLEDIAQRFGFSGVRSATVQKHKCLQKIRTLVKKMNSYA